MSGYAIVCTARKGGSLGIGLLALVDRAKSKRLWWTSDNPRIAIRYRDKDAAQFAASRLRWNNPRVIPFADAKNALREQATEINFQEAHQYAMDDSEAGWDDHKIWSTGL